VHIRTQYGRDLKASDIDIFLSNAAWAICSTYHTVLKAPPGAAIFRRNMLFDIPFIADWQKIGEHRQRLTDLNNARENEGRIDYDYKVGQKELLWKEGILLNAESRWHKNPWLITSVHTNGTITVQRGNKIEWMNIRRVCVCVILTSGRGELPSNAVPTTGRIHPPQRLQRHTPA
jgi:hypothetical protein